jgi:hypothetical protein
MRRSNLAKLGLSIMGLPVAALLLYQVPSVNSRLEWRLDVAQTYLRGMVNPVEAMPTSLPQPAVAVTRLYRNQPSTLFASANICQPLSLGRPLPSRL